jgi:hypothetical protein
MQTELPAQTFAAIATVTAALITAAISFVNLTLNKEQKISEFRQAWIGGLRQDLASFFACSRAYMRATDEANKENETHLTLTPEKISEIRYQVAETRYRIQLRLNLTEPEHKELFRLMNGAIEKLNGNSDTANKAKAIEAAAEFAPQVLKSEWERVKQGELAFRVARKWIAPFIFVLSLLFFYLVVPGK